MSRRGINWVPFNAIPKGTVSDENRTRVFGNIIQGGEAKGLCSNYRQGADTIYSKLDKRERVYVHR